MRVLFTKMHGASNDFIVVDEWMEEAIPADKKAEFAATVCDRRRMIGADGVIFVQKSEDSDGRFVLYNSDGSLAEICGNGIRCFAKYIYEKGYVAKTQVRVETLAGMRELDLTLFNDRVEQVRVDMGNPHFLRKDVGISGNPADTFINQEVLIDGISYRLTCVGIGGPHLVLFADDVGKVDIARLGGEVQKLGEVFYKGASFHAVQAEGKNRFRIRSYDKIAGSETLACGNGVCAAAVAAVVTRRAEPQRTFVFNTEGGELDVEIRQEGSLMRIFLIGPAVESFRGWLEYNLSEKFEKAAYNFISDALPQK
jgi:diaminopimelate epimerase